MEVTFKQIAGLLARRIVFTPHEGDRLERGQRVGLIKFGSRVDVVFPVDAELRVKTGQRVKGGESVLAAMPVAELTAGMGTGGSGASAGAGANRLGGVR